MKNVTARLADYILTSRLDDIPHEIRHEARRALLNYVGCAIGGSTHRAVEIAIAALGPHSGQRTVRVLGRQERFDPLLVSLLNGISSHVYDYDDTIPTNYIHASSPVASALLAYADGVKGMSGRNLVLAFILGFETVSRIGNATYPAHYNAGWHSTGSIGGFGAAAAIGRLIGLSQEKMIWALGLAATQAAGLREMFGSMAKSFHPGRAAQSGYMAALLARNGFTAGIQALEGPCGFAAVQSTAYDLGKITDGLGVDFELRNNTYKPFPCGLVIHPTIDACIQIRNEHKLDPLQIAFVRLRVAPIVKDLCDKKSIVSGLESKFSVYHAAAIGLVRGKAGPLEFTDAAANDPVIRKVRDSVQAVGDDTISEDGVYVEIKFTNGRVLNKRLEYSIGNAKRPLSDNQLEEKFRDQATALSEQQVNKLIRACWNIEELDDVAKLISLAIPQR